MSLMSRDQNSARPELVFVPHNRDAVRSNVHRISIRMMGPSRQPVGIAHSETKQTLKLRSLFWRLSIKCSKTNNMDIQMQSSH